MNDPDKTESTATPGLAAYEAHRASFWKRHGMGDRDPLPEGQWKQMSGGERGEQGDWEAAAQAAAEAVITSGFIGGIRQERDDAESHLAFMYQHRGVTSNRLGHALAALREIAGREDDDDDPVVVARHALDDDAALREGAQELAQPASIADLDAATGQRDEANRALAALEPLAAHWETLASQFDAESRKPEAVADKPHQARLTGRAAQARYCASWLREALGGHAAIAAQEPKPAPEVRPGQPDEGAFWAWMDAYVDEPHNTSYEVPDMQRAYEAGQATAEAAVEDGSR